MSLEKPRLLLIDDNTNVELLANLLNDTDYEAECVDSEEEAWFILQRAEIKFSAVLLGRFMTETGGIKLLKQIKKDLILKSLPIIVLTEKVDNKKILEGFEAGVSFYITKPFERSYLLSIIRSAVDVFQWNEELGKNTGGGNPALSSLRKGVFQFKTINEGRNLVSLLANLYPKSSELALGLSELAINAVEHGNLGITYHEKGHLLESGELQKEIERRQQLPKNRNKSVTLFFEQKLNQLVFTIQDCGKGFLWKSYLEMDPKRAFDAHGRGIAMAKAMSFDELRYENNGATAVAIVNL